MIAKEFLIIGFFEAVKVLQYTVILYFAVKFAVKHALMELDNDEQ